jgi:hypothetical protein
MVLVVSFIFVGCPSHDKKVKLADSNFNLVDSWNPFIGKWESNIPSMNSAKMVSEFGTDGTYTCTFPDLSSDIYKGGYLVEGNIMVTFLSVDGGIGGYTFEVVDNGAIKVTEIVDVNEDGSIETGNTVPFTRFPNSPVNSERKSLALNTTLIGGTWHETSTPQQTTYQFKIDGKGIMKYNADGQQLSSEIAYSVVHDKGIDETVLILFVPETNKFTAYSFAIKENENTITVKEITEIKTDSQKYTAAYGIPVIFTRKLD